MDDGSVKSRESKGVVFNTQCYFPDDVTRLMRALGQHQLVCGARKQKEGLQIYVSGTSYETFRNIVDPFILASMRYKIPVDRIT